MFHTRIARVALAGVLIASGALAQEPMEQRQTPTDANRVVAPGATPAASPTSGGAGASAANRPGGEASQPSATGAPGTLSSGGGTIDASAAGARVGGVGGATQAQGSTTSTAALPANQFRQGADNRAAAAPGAGKPVTPADLSREAQIRQLADPKGGLNTSATSPGAGLVGGSSAADLVRNAGATPQPGAGKNEVSRQGQQSSESWVARNPLEQKWRDQNIARTGVDRQPTRLERRDLQLRYDRGQGLPTPQPDAYTASQTPPPERPITPGSVWSDVTSKVFEVTTGDPVPGKFKPNPNIPNNGSGVRGKPNPEGTVRPEGNPVPMIGAGRAPISAADAARKAQIGQPVDDQRRVVERMTPTPEARRDMVAPSGTRTNPADGRSGDGTTPSPGTAKPGGAPPPGGDAPEQVDQSRPGSRPGKKPDDPSGS